MIFHLSIAAEQPQHVAEVIAELWCGRAFPFPPFKGSWIAFAGDDRGSAIEVYPSQRELVPGADEVKMRANPELPPRSATHIAIATPLDEADVHRIGAREGWTVMTCNRGPFRVVELWIENNVLAEVLTSEMQQEYLGSMTPANWQTMIESGAVAR